MGLFDVHHKIIGKEIQNQIENTTIAIIGLGGLGCHVAQILYRTGFKNLILIDDDLVQESNLPRQILFHQSDIGKSKVTVAKAELERFCKGNIQCFQKRLTSKNAIQLLKNTAITVDCTDNFTARYAISESCKQLDIPMIYGGVNRFDIQVATFGFQNGMYFHEAFPNKKLLFQSEDCNASGVLPHMIALAANYQVNEIIKMFCSENIKTNQLFCFNANTGKQRWINLRKPFKENN
ncbi:MAG: HesA/MoeB/ThiF family protein [Flavobacteriales bacterium]